MQTPPRIKREQSASLDKTSVTWLQGCSCSGVPHWTPSGLHVSNFPLTASCSCWRCEDCSMSSWLELSMAQEEDKHSLEAKFSAAVKVIRSLPEEGDHLFVILLMCSCVCCYSVKCCACWCVNTPGEVSWPTCRAFKSWHSWLTPCEDKSWLTESVISQV